MNTKTLTAALMAALALPALAETPSAGCGTASPSSGTFTLASDGLTRTYRLHVPAALDAAKPAPLALISTAGAEMKTSSSPIRSSPPRPTSAGSS